jgi:hypothetical protein
LVFWLSLTRADFETWFAHRLLFGYAMPAFECFKTVETRPNDAHMLRFWCQYWCVPASFTPLLPPSVNRHLPRVVESQTDFNSFQSIDHAFAAADSTSVAHRPACVLPLAIAIACFLFTL